MRLDNQVAVVTGSGSGLGQAIAIAFAEAGATVVVTDLAQRLHNAKKTRDRIIQLGRKSVAVSLNVTSIRSIRRMVKKTIDQYGRIDILVNNAGVNISKPAVEVTEDDWDKVLDVNLKGVFFCCQEVGRTMIERRFGKIINVASQNGVIGYYNRAAYCSSKAGVVNLTRVLAIEWASKNINVNAIGPTFVRTPLTDKLFQEESFTNEVLRRIPLGRLGQPEDITGSVVFLASSAAQLITGHTLLIDGGWTAI
jgi:2-deoxy-D-gluconate 3-dehydrogenase